jgi:DNA topoisomerase-6 subunit B
MELDVVASPPKSRTTGKTKGARALAAAVAARQPSLFEDGADAPQARAKAKAREVEPRGVDLPEHFTEDVPPPPPRRKGSKDAGPETATSLAEKQRDISVSEFFAKNRHLLGFDSAARALLTAVKEAVDNALDACEEAHVLPEIVVRVAQVAEDRFRVTVEDNGPGIVKAQIPKVFGKLLYGSKFHRLRQSRGQQGIGISAAAMYGQLTTGQPTVVVSKTGKGEAAHHYELTIDTRKNRPEIVREKVTTVERDHGTSVTIELEGEHKRGRRSVDEYVQLTALANPHAKITYHPPKDEPVVYERVARGLPVPPREIQPHPYGVELGFLAQLLRDSSEHTIRGALSNAFSRVSSRVADDICEKAGLSPTANPRRLGTPEAERLFRAIPQVKILAPPVNCLSPIGEDLIKAALYRRVADAELVESCTRSPEVYRGNPFQVEVGLAWGGSLPAEELIELYRLGNRVPLQYQQSACAITKAVMSVPWKNYQVQQSSGALPTGPMVLFVHLASVWVPFTSESKEAIASYDVILKEIRLAVMEVGRRLGIYLRKSKRRADEMKKRAYINDYLPHVGIAMQEILKLSDAQRDEVVGKLRDVMERSRRTI